MIPYKLADQSFTIPEGWHEITLKQWLSLRTIDINNICAILGVITGIPEETWFYARQIEMIEKMIPNMKWIGRPFDLKKQPIPETVMLNGETVTVPKDITIKTFGQKLTYQNEMAKHLNDDGNVKVEFLPMNLAIYLCPEPFTDQKAFALVQHIEAMPVTQAYPIGSFFLTSFLKSSPGNPST